MKSYYLIKDGCLVDGPSELPQSFKNVSNFNCLSDEEARVYGWLPLVEESTGGDIFVRHEITIGENEVRRLTVNRDRSSNEIEVVASTHIQEKESWLNFRRNRDNLLLLTDRYMLIDNWNKLSLEDQEKMTLYRQQLRDLPTEVTDPDNFIFPGFPL